MSDRVASLSESIEKLRHEFRLGERVKLKFTERPKEMEQADFVELKRQIFRRMTEHEVGLFAYVILHDIARNPDEARRNGINTVAYNFDFYLQQVRQPGMVFIDRFIDKDKKFSHHLEEKFSIGCVFGEGGRKRLRNILGFHYVSVGQSHFSSLSDMAASALRYILNVHTRGEERSMQIAATLAEQIEPLFLKNGNGVVDEHSFVFSPKEVRFPPYCQKYLGLQEYLARIGIRTAQRIEQGSRR